MQLNHRNSSPPSANQCTAAEVLELLATLSHRDGDLKTYLSEIADGMIQLIGVDWAVITYCQDDRETVLASTIDLGEEEPVYPLHGTLTNTVFQTGDVLAVEDTSAAPPEYGSPPESYQAYLGTPLRLPSGKTIGTICSFSHQPRQFLPDQIQIAQLFAERAATAIDNYSLYQQQQQFNDRLTAEVEQRTAELRAAQDRMIQQERLAAIGEFTAMIVHELRNPLTTIEMSLKAVSQSPNLSERDEKRLAFALEEEARLKRLLNEILLYAKPHLIQQQIIDLNSFLAEILETMKTSPKAAGRSLRFLTQDAAQVLGDVDKLKQVFFNLLENACEAAPASSTITCRLNLSTGKMVCIAIHNLGEPIPLDCLKRLTEPFYTTKSSGNGLGLAIVSRLVEAHSGQLDIQSSEQDGTLISVQLPLVERSD